MELYETLRPTQKRFLGCFAACGSLTKAARWAKITRENHYLWLDSDASYAALWPQFRVRAGEMLLDEAVRRAKEGVVKVVRYKGRVVGTELEYSDQLMAKLLSAHLPEMFRERFDQRLSGPNGEPLMSEEQARRMLEASAPPAPKD